MKNPASRLFPLLLPLLVSGCTGAGESRRDVLAVLERQQSAWNDGDIERFMELTYWPSPELTFFSGDSVTKGFEQLEERYRARYQSEGTEMGELSFGELECIGLENDLAVVRGRWALHFEDREDSGGLFTLVLRRTPVGWRIVHDHTSVATGDREGT